MKNVQNVRQDEMVQLDLIGRDIVDAAFKVHCLMGPGLLESVYEECMFHELGYNRGLSVKAQVEIPVKYDGHPLSSRLRLDLLVEECVVIEIKAVETMLPLFGVQLLTYLKLTDLRLGYLINFNVPLIKTGIKRMIL